MKQLEAMKATLALAKSRGYNLTDFEVVGVDYEHLESMVKRAEENYDTTAEQGFSEAKLGRWLGYMQGVLVANDCATLEEFKELNRSFADGPTS